MSTSANELDHTEEDAERLWTVKELSANLSLSRTTITGLIDGGSFGAYMDVSTSGTRLARRVPESGRLAYLAARTMNPRRTR